MVFIKKVLLVGAVLVPVMLASACATPQVLETRMPSDANLNCQQLAAAIEETRTVERGAREDRGVTGTNVAAAVFFWPALVGTYMNTEEAMKAAQERRQYLQGLQTQKNCPV